MVKSLIHSKQAALLAPKANHRMIYPPPYYNNLIYSTLRNKPSPWPILGERPLIAPYYIVLAHTHACVGMRHARHSTPKANNETIINK